MYHYPYSNSQRSTVSNVSSALASSTIISSTNYARPEISSCTDESEFYNDCQLDPVRLLQMQKEYLLSFCDFQEHKIKSSCLTGNHANLNEELNAAIVNSALSTPQRLREALRMVQRSSSTNTSACNSGTYSAIQSVATSFSFGSRDLLLEPDEVLSMSMGKITFYVKSVQHRKVRLIIAAIIFLLAITITVTVVHFATTTTTTTTTTTMAPTSIPSTTTRTISLTTTRILTTQTPATTLTSPTIQSTTPTPTQTITSPTETTTHIITTTTTTTTTGPCSSNPCKNNGTCNRIGSDYNCTCTKPYYSGKDCSEVLCFPPILEANKNTWQTLSTPEFPTLIGDLNCLWPIRAPYGEQIVIIVDNVTIVGDGPDRIFQVSNVFSTSSTITAMVNLTLLSSFATIFFDTQGASGDFSLQYSSIASDPCADPNPCSANSTCVANGLSAECQCFPCWTGTLCDVYQGDPCAGFGALCGAHGSCDFDHLTCKRPYCACVDGYSGPFCSTPPG